MAEFTATVTHTSSGGAGASKTALSGFLVMEYYALILNRTFIVFIAPDGLYGWKVHGIVAAGAARDYFQDYAKSLDDPKLMNDVTAARDLAKLKGGFFIPRSEIASVEIVPKQKEGMAGIYHTGRILIHFASGKKREFILLGQKIDTERIKRLILA
jgi:hypothetical protein